MPGETKNQFSLTRVAPSTSERQKSNFLSITRDFWLNGLVDEPIFFGRALSDGEIQDLNRNGAATPCRELKFLALPVPSAVAYVGVSTTPFSAIASGTGRLAYQWQHDGTNLPGKTSATFSLPNPQLADAGNYTVVVTDRTHLSPTMHAAGSAGVCVPEPTGSP